jgi:hypothetical protein
MESHIAFKLCGKCRVVKAVPEFSKNKSSKDGRQAYCRSCVSAYAKTDAGKARQKAYRESGKGKAAVQKWNRSDGARAAVMKWQESDKGKAWLTNPANLDGQRKWRASDVGKESKRRSNDNPPHRAAHHAVEREVKFCRLARASTMDCEGACGKRAAHWHHDSYREADRLNVTAFCVKCHRAWHRLNEVIYDD